ncbi:MAG TPA: YlxR family protein [Mycobacterium sp.]|nr:YlxR family protein [Mycobacterium sp.]
MPPPRRRPRRIRVPHTALCTTDSGLRPFRISRAQTVDSGVIQRESPASPHRRTEGPVRTCVGCRKRELAAELLRVVAEGRGNGICAVTVDPAGNLPGRGAWLHPDQKCLNAAIRRRAFARALRITGSPETSAVSEHFEKFEAPRRPAREQAAKNMSTP